MSRNQADVKHFIEIRNLEKIYISGDSEINAIQSMDFTVDDGEFVTIMGQSGSGKSTLLSILGAMNRPTRGEVLVDSLDLYSLTREQRADFRSEYLGFIFQSFQLIPYLTVLENVTLPMAITGRKKMVKKAMSMAVIERVGLGEKANRLPDQLSGGEQERVAIARAIVNRAPGYPGRRTHREPGFINGTGDHGPAQRSEPGGAHRGHGDP